MKARSSTHSHATSLTLKNNRYRVSGLRATASLCTPNSQLNWSEYNNAGVSNGLKISKRLLTRLAVRISCVGRPSCTLTSILDTRNRHEIQGPRNHTARSGEPMRAIQMRRGVGGLALCAVAMDSQDLRCRRPDAVIRVRTTHSTIDIKSVERVSGYCTTYVGSYRSYRVDIFWELRNVAASVFIPSGALVGAQIDVRIN